MVWDYGVLGEPWLRKQGKTVNSRIVLMSCIILLILLTVKLVHFLSLVNLSHSPITITSSKFNGRVNIFCLTVVLYS